MAKKQFEKSFLRVIIEILKYSFMCWPVVMVIYLLIGLVFGSMAGANFWIMQYTFDAVGEVALGSRQIPEMVLPLALFITFLLGKEVIISMYYYYMSTMGDRMHGFMCKKIAEKSAKLDPIVFENPQALDNINKASQGTHLAFWAGNTIITVVIFYLPFLLITTIYLYSLNPMLIFVVVLAFTPKLATLLIRAKLYTDLEEKSAPLRRSSQYYEDAIVDLKYFKETRLLGIFSFFKEKYLNSIRLLNRETWKTDSRAATFDLITQIIMALSYFGILYLLFISLQNQLITVGAFAAVLANLNQLNDNIEELLTYHFAKVAEDLGKISYLINFFDLPEKSGATTAVNWQGDIEFKNVNFTYPNAEKASLKDLSLTIKAGETVAIVGENGSGKSTFTKLLLGLYEPTSGEITVANQNIKNIDPKQLFSGATAVFQQYQRYQLTLKENIRLSEIDAKNRDINRVLNEAGVDWESRSYPDGVDTMLSREFDGVDLSGGQWQRVAIARGLYRYHDLIILDEPTAAIDPLEESRLYEKFAKISADKTAVIVTHRLGSAQIADKIIVLADGKIVEIGTHQQLMENTSHYQQMYNSQASWYMS